jgi:hypothetical protein
MFLVRPHPLENEHILNYLLRLSTVNGFKNTIQLLRCSHFSLTNNRLPPKKLFTGDFDVKYLQEQCHLSGKQLHNTLFHKQDTRFYRFNNFTLPIVSINFSRPTFCPRCFCDSFNQPASHLLFAMTHCEKHKCALIEYNPETGRRLTWTTPNLLSIMEHLLVSSSEVQTPLVNRNIDELFNQIDSTKNLLGGYEKLNLNDYLILLNFFIHYHQRTTSKKTLRLTQIRGEQRTILFQTAHEYIDHWPNGFYRLLNYYEFHPLSKRGDNGIRHCYSDLYDEIYLGKQQKIPAYQHLFSAFNNYLENEFSSSAFNNHITRLTAPLHTSSQLISEQSASKILKVPVTHLSIYVRLGLLIQQPSGNYFQKDIQDLPKKIKNFMTLDQTSKLLNISKGQVLQLVRAELIGCATRASIEYRDWIFEKENIQKFITKVKQLAVDEHSLNSSTHPTTFKLMTFRSENIVDMLNDILSGKTAVTFVENYSNPLSLQQFHPCFNDSDQPDGYLSPQQASEELGVNINAIYDFAKRDFLPIKKLQTGRTARPIKLISRSSIEQFKNIYVLSKHINKINRSHFKLISGPSINGGVVNLYIRD